MTEHGFAAWVEVDLGALRDNLDRLRAVTPSRIAPVLKADAYGHGAVEVAHCLRAAGVELLIVARPSEAVSLREAGVDGRLLVLTPPDPAIWSLLVEHKLEVTCSTPESLAFLSGAAARSPVPVHLKVNTGMNRLGLPVEQVDDALRQLEQAAGVAPVALCSHLADADLPASPRTRRQVAEFEALVAALGGTMQGLETHLANSAGVLHHDVSDHTWVRPGLALYGYDPNSLAELTPVMSVHARVLQVHDLEAGEQVGYGGRWTASEPSRVAIIGVGYGDGYPWHQTGTAEVLTTAGRRPLVGAVSMDMLAFQAAPGDRLGVGDRVTLLGQLRDQRIDAHELARNAGTITWEILLRLGRRLPRVYLATNQQRAEF